MTDPVLLLFLGLVVGVACVVYWRIIAAALAIVAIGIFAVGVVTVVQAVQNLTP